MRTRECLIALVAFGYLYYLSKNDQEVRGPVEGCVVPAVDAQQERLRNDRSRFLRKTTRPERTVRTGPPVTAGGASGSPPLGCAYGRAQMIVAASNPLEGEDGSRIEYRTVRVLSTTA